MSLRVEKIDRKCPNCLENMTRTSLKSMFLDDFLEHCTKDGCNLSYDGASNLSSVSNAIAKQMDDELPVWGSDEV